MVLRPSDLSSAPALTLPRAPVPRTAAAPPRARRAAPPAQAAPAQAGPAEAPADLLTPALAAVRCCGRTLRGFPCPGDAAVGRYCAACARRQSPVRSRTLARVSPLGVVLMAAFVYTLYKLVTTGIYVRLFDF